MLPDLLTQPHEPVRDRQLLQRLTNWALRFSPSVQPDERDVLFVDITGCERLFGGERNIARQAIGGLARQGFDARAAIADTLGAAYALATTGVETVQIAAPDQAAETLGPLPPRGLRLDDVTLAKLDALGIRRIGELLALPRNTLLARFGELLVRRLREALGERIEPLAAHLYQAPPATRLGFETPLTDPRPLPDLLEQMLTEVAQQLEQRGLGVQRLDLVVYFEQVPPLSAPVRLARPSRAWKHIGALLRERIERLDFSPGVTGLLLAAGDTTRWQSGQGRLFEFHDPRAEQDLGCLIDRLSNRLGSAAIVRPRPVDDHQPEFAFQYDAVAVVGCKPCAGDVLPEGDPPDAEMDTPSTNPDRATRIGLGHVARPALISRGDPALLKAGDGPFLKPTSLIHPDCSSEPRRQQLVTPWGAGQAPRGPRGPTVGGHRKRGAGAASIASVAILTAERRSTRQPSPPSAGATENQPSSIRRSIDKETTTAPPSRSWSLCRRSPTSDPFVA